VRERRAARELSAEIDRALADGGERAGESPLVATARQLQELGKAFPPVPIGLEQRVDAAVAAALSVPPLRRAEWARGRLRPALLGALAATLALLGLFLAAPAGQQVSARMVRALLGQTSVELTPTIGAESPSIREPMRDLVAVELMMGRQPSLPRSLPQGYVLTEIAAVSYPDLPPWISQPLFVEFCYGLRDEPPGLRLRQYRLLFRQGGQLSGVQVAGDAVAEFEPVDVSGVPGTLLTIAPRGDPAGPASGQTYTLLWERDGMLLELESDCLGKEELLSVARSVR